MIKVAEGLSLHFGIWNKGTVQWRYKITSTTSKTTVILNSFQDPQQPKQNNNRYNGD
jgi:hypothetical protein